LKNALKVFRAGPTIALDARRTNGEEIVKIDGIFGPEHQKLSKGKGDVSKSKDSAAASIFGEQDAEHVKAEQALLRAAMAAEPVNPKAVEEARELLASGGLDTPEAARRAAQRLLSDGL
jgi:hypothetical protein